MSNKLFFGRLKSCMLITRGNNPRVEWQTILKRRNYYEKNHKNRCPAGVASISDQKPSLRLDAQPLLSPWCIPIIRAPQYTPIAWYPSWSTSIMICTGPASPMSDWLLKAITAVLPAACCLRFTASWKRENPSSSEHRPVAVIISTALWSQNTPVTVLASRPPTSPLMIPALGVQLPSLNFWPTVPEPTEPWSSASSIKNWRGF